MKNRVFAGLLFFSLLGLSHSVYAACEFSFSDVRQNNQSPYSMFNPGSNVIEMTINLRSNECQQLAFTFESGNRNVLTGPNGKIPYQLQSLSGRSIDSNGVSTVPGRDLLTRGQNRAIVVRALVQPGSFSGPGTYTDKISLLAQDGHSLLDEIDITLALRVSPEADISLTGKASNGYSATGGGGMNFGRLNPGKERSAFLFVRSNVNYALNIISENRGFLAHRHESGEHARIPYSAWLDNERLDLAHSTTVQSGGMTPVYRSRPHKLDARIEPFSEKLAGDYQDIILVEVIFLE